MNWPNYVVDYSFLLSENGSTAIAGSLNLLKKNNASIHLGEGLCAGDDDLHDITICIGNWNRTAYLKLLLNQYLYQDYPKDKFRIIITDDSSDDYNYLKSDSPEEIVKYAMGVDPSLNVSLYQTHRDFGGANWRWNVGLRRATGDFIINSDSDVLPIGVDFLRRYSRSVRKVQSIYGASTIFMPVQAIASPTEEGVWVYNNIDTADIRNFITLLPTYRFEHDYGFGFSVDLAKKTRGFYEYDNGGSGRYGGAEYDFIWRVQHSGGKIVLMEDVFVVTLPNSFFPLELADVWYSKTLGQGKASMSYPMPHNIYNNAELWGNPKGLERLI